MDEDLNVFVDGERWSTQALHRVLFEEEDDEPDIANDKSSDDESDHEEPMEDTGTEQSGDEEEEERERLRGLNVLYGKNMHRWSLDIPQKQGRRSANNIVKHFPGPKGLARQAKCAIDFWSCLFDENILHKIIIHTNEEIQRRRDSNLVLQSYHEVTNEIEFRAFVGLLYYSGAQKSSKRSVDELWNPRKGASMYRGTMSEHRFLFLLSCVRFDDKMDRTIRRIEDKFAPIREIWSLFIENCKSSYTPFELCTIDEQLLGYRGKCPFRIYMASKPDKYGIKIVMLNDSKTYYMLNGIPYTGKVNVSKGESVPSYYVKELSKPIKGTNRNITVDNWFSSIPLFKEMLQQGLTMVGTLRKNKREIPPSFLKGSEVGKTIFGYDDCGTLLSYTPKKNKVVLLLSSMGHTNDINNNTGLPEIIDFYNNTKGGTDCFDKMCKTYTTDRATRRWPLRMFFGMLDQCGINAYVLHSFKNLKVTRKIFLHGLSWALIEPQLKVRLQCTTLRRSLRQTIHELGVVEEPSVDDGQTLTRKTRCSFCPRSKDRKTKYVCLDCQRPICEDHRAYVCHECSTLD